MVFLSEDPDEKYPDQAEQPARQTDQSTDKKLLENVDQPSEEVAQPAGEKEPIDESVGKVDKPAENSDKPSVNGDLNLTKVDQLSEEFDRPPVKSEDREKPVLHNGTVAEEQCDTAEAETLVGVKDESKDKAPENVIRTEEKIEAKAPAEAAVGETMSAASQEECTDGSQGSKPAEEGKGEDVEDMQVDSDSLAEAAKETTDSSNGEAEVEKSTAAEATKPSGPIMRIVNETEAYEDSDKEENEEDAMEVEEQEEEEKKSGVEAVQNGDGEERKDEGEMSEDSKKKESQEEGDKLKLVEVNGDSSKLLEADNKEGEEEEEKETKKEVKKLDSLDREEEKKAEKENEKEEEEVKEKAENEKKEGETKKAETEKEEEAKKPTLKLASFADITEEMDKNQESSPHKLFILKSAVSGLLFNLLRNSAFSSHFGYLNRYR